MHPAEAPNTPEVGQNASSDPFEGESVVGEAESDPEIQRELQHLWQSLDTLEELVDDLGSALGPVRKHTTADQLEPEGEDTSAESEVGGEIISCIRRVNGIRAGVDAIISDLAV